MRTSANERVRRLATLVRLRELQLEQARAERAALDAALERQRRHVDELQRQLERSRALAQERVAGSVSVDALRQVHDYLRWHAGVLAEQRTVLERARTLAEEARARVTRQFERLSAIERARERHARLAATLRARQEQNRLDDQAPPRAAAASRSARHI